MPDEPTKVAALGLALLMLSGMAGAVAFAVPCYVYRIVMGWWRGEQAAPLGRR